MLVRDVYAVAEHAWCQYHQARRQDELRLKEALLIQKSKHFNRDMGEELPRCWTS